MLKTYNKKIVSIILTFFFILLFNYPVIGKVSDKEILNKIKKIKIPFIQNRGQIKNNKVMYYAKTMGGTFFVTKDGGMVYSMKGWVIKESLVGASISDVKGEEKAETKVSYFKGKDPKKWTTNIETYNLINLGEIYKGIELKLKAYGNNVEKVFYIKPEYDLGKIRIKIEGAKGLSINKSGELEVETGLGIIKFTRPYAYQYINGNKVKVSAEYSLMDSALIYGFKVGNYDRKRPLIIDPLLASTFIGGYDYDWSNSIALDGSGNVYVIGYTWSSDYPTTSGAYNENFNDYSDVFV